MKLIFILLFITETIISQTWSKISDFPGVARAFGWHGPPRDTPRSIWDAYEFLEENVGADIDDPGYFD